MAQFDWVHFYKAFAKALLNYKESRSDLIQIIKTVYKEIGINLPTLERDNQIVDIDPFTVFGLFNKSKLKESNRVKIITAFAKKFSVDAAIPTSFDAVPVLNNQNATFYYWTGDRGPDDIDHLWDLFESALEYVKTPSDDKRQVVSKYFDLGSFGVVLSCGVRARKALFYKAFTGFYFLSGSVKWCSFLRKWCSKWCSGIG